MPKVLFISDSTNYGRGDYEYLLHISSNAYLQENGWDLEALEVHRVFSLSIENDTLWTTGKKREAKIKSSKRDKMQVLVYPNKRSRDKKLAQAIKKYNPAHLVFVSNIVSQSQVAQFTRSLPNVRVTLIGGHGSNYEQARADGLKVYGIGLEHGFLMSEPVVDPSDLRERVAAFNQVSALDYKNFLLQGASAEDFLKYTLFVPAYLQDRTIAQGFVQGLACSKIAAGYEAGMVVHLSPHKNIAAGFSTTQEFKHLFDKKTCEAMLNNGYKKIVIKCKNKLLEIELEQEEKGEGKTFTIISGIYLNKKSDFELLYGFAQKIAACSGDNTLNNAFAKGVCPFYATQRWNRKFKEKLIAFIAEMMPPDSKEEIIITLEGLMPNVGSRQSAAQVAEAFINALNKAEELKQFEMLAGVLKTIQTDHNFALEMPKIVKSIAEDIELVVEDPEAGPVAMMQDQAEEKSERGTFKFNLKKIEQTKVQVKEREPEVEKAPPKAPVAVVSAHKAKLKQGK